VSTARLEIPEQALRELDKKLVGLQGIQQSKVLLDGMRAAGRAVRKRAQEIAPVPTTKKYKRGSKASLKTTPAYRIKAFVHELAPMLEVRVKAAKRAPHFHLVELGHRIVTKGGVDTGERTTPTPFISLGGKYSNREQVLEMQKAIKRALSKLTGG
jgi:hypothetical protein